MEAGGSECTGVLKTRKLLFFRNAQYAENGKIALNWNVSGTRGFLHRGAVFLSNKRNRARRRDIPIRLRVPLLLEETQRFFSFGTRHFSTFQQESGYGITAGRVHWTSTGGLPWTSLV